MQEQSRAKCDAPDKRNPALISLATECTTMRQTYRMRSFIPADQLVGECQTRHEPALLQPEYSGERAGEEDTLDTGESDEANSEGLHVSVFE